MHRQFSFASSRSRPKIPVHKQQEAKWLRQLCAGETTAWKELVDLWSPLLYNYVLYNVAHEAEAQQLLTSIFSAIAKAIVGSQYIANLTILIFSTAHQAVLYYRHQNPYPTATNPSTLSTTSATQSSSGATGFLDTFYRFTPELQQILLLYYLCGLSVSDISQIMGEREDLLIKLLRRAQVHLLSAK
jgi:DNA-directed RNA polymerase specialized sigma24 family protein